MFQMPPAITPVLSENAMSTVEIEMGDTVFFSNGKSGMFTGFCNENMLLVAENGNCVIYPLEAISITETIAHMI